MAYCAGTGYDYEANRPIPIIHDPFYFTSYSLYYHDIEARIAYAFDAFDHGQISSDTVSYVEFYFGDQEGEVVIDAGGDPLIRLTRSTALRLPD